MTIGTTEKTIVSKSKRRRHNIDTQQVVYKTYIGKHKGKSLFSSKTKHEKI